MAHPNNNLLANSIAIRSDSILDTFIHPLDWAESIIHCFIHNCLELLNFADLLIIIVNHFNINN